MGGFPVYMREVAYVKNGVIFKEQELACLRLSASLMANLFDSDDDDNDEDREATSYPAAENIRVFEYMFSFYGVNVHNTASCQLADNCALNERDTSRRLQ